MINFFKKLLGMGEGETIPPLTPPPIRKGITLPRSLFQGSKTQLREARMGRSAKWRLARLHERAQKRLHEAAF